MKLSVKTIKEGRLVGSFFYSYQKIMYLREYLQSTHAISRRKFTDFVDKGQIFLDWTPVISYKQEIVDGDKLLITDHIDETIKISWEIQQSTMVIFNKPMGYVASKSDPHNQTIYALLPQELQGFYYIGRLDKDSHGLLLLTNDPKLVNEFEHPKFAIEKEYIVKIDRPLTSRDAQRMKEWLVDEGEALKVADCKLLESCLVNIILHEGKKRHIRRIFKVMNYKVLDLQRIREGEFELGNLKLGEWKKINDKF